MTGSIRTVGGILSPPTHGDDEKAAQSRHHPAGKPAADPAARRHFDLTRPGEALRQRLSTRNWRSTRRWQTARHWGTRPASASPARGARRALVASDRDRLAQVFSNLISNAIKYNTAPGPTVTIASRLRRARYEVTVSDKDKGRIQDAEREAIFVKFARRGVAGRAGARLGFAISRQIVTGFGGTLAASKSPQGGAAFTVSLPLTQPTPPESGTG
ncbi:MAG: ATP-binding protein [Nitratireductor sp.]